MVMTNLERFTAYLTLEYSMPNVPKDTAHLLATKVTAGLLCDHDTAHTLDNPAIYRVCRVIGIPYTYKAIQAYLYGKYVGRSVKRLKG